MALVLEIKVDSSKAINGLNQFKNKVQHTETTGVKASGNLFSSFSKLRSLMAGGMVISAGMMAKKFVEMASDAQETANKFEQVFKGSAIASEGLNKLVKYTKFSDDSFKEYLSTIGLLLKGMGMTEDQAASMATAFVQRGIDVGSLANVEMVKIVEDLGSALAGSTETLRKYGTNATETAVAQEAVNLGLITASREYIKLEPEIKNQVRAHSLLSLWLKTTADAEGDLAINTNTYAYQSRLLDEQLKEIQITIGEKLLPTATKLVTQINTEVIPQFINLFQWLEKNDDKFNDFMVSLQDIPVDNIKSAFKTLKEIFWLTPDMQAQITEVAEQAKNVKTEIIPLAKATTDAAKAASDNADSTTKETNALKQQIKALQDIINSKSKLNEKTIKAKELSDEFWQGIPESETFIEQMISLDDQWDELTKSVGETTEAGERFLEFADELKKKNKEVGTSLAEQAGEWQKVISNAQQMVSIIKQIKSAYDEMREMAQKPLSKWNTWDFLRAAEMPMQIGSSISKFIFGSGMFQHGADFTVGGYGGIDSQLVAFRATPGERVTVTPQTQSVNNVTNNTPVSINLTINAQMLDENYVRTKLVPQLNKLINFDRLRIR